jgi:hypothetical protein
MKYRDRRDLRGRMDTVFSPLFFLIILLLVFPSQLSSSLWPIERRIYLNSSFAECRPNHFHAGIDLHATVGTPLKAIGDGHVWHVAVNPFGYGKSLFLVLEDGKVVVYAHLDRFTGEIKRLVELEQQRRFSYRVSLYFKEERFCVKKGEIIGYAGTTGAMGAHLHFEIRDPQNRPINPLNHGYAVEDSTPPLIKAVQITPLDDTSLVAGIPFPIIVSPSGNGGFYTVRDTISIEGSIGLEILAEDYQNEWPFRLNVERIDMYLNGNLTFKSVFERFSYAHTREVELEFNYDLYTRGFGRYHRLYLYGDNHLSFYEKRGGILKSGNLKKVNEVKIVCYDSNSNVSVVILYLKRRGSDTVKEWLALQSPYLKREGISFYKNLVGISLSSPDSTKVKKAQSIVPMKKGFSTYGKFFFFSLVQKKSTVCTLIVAHSGKEEVFVFPYGRISRDQGGSVSSSDGQCIVSVNKGQSYEDLFTRISKVHEEIPEGMVLKKGAYSIEPVGAIFKGEVDIIIPYQKTTSKKTGIYKKMKDGWLFLGNTYDKSKKGFVAGSRHLGTFALIEDNAPPEILDFVLKVDGENVEKIAFIVKDVGSGLKMSDIHLSIDGKPYIPAIEPYFDEIFPLLFDEKMKIGGHTAEISVGDQAGNRGSLSVSF